MVTKNFISFLTTLVFSFSSLANEGHEIKFENCIPKNDLYIPSFIEGQGVSKAEFNEVIDRFERVYAPIVSQLGGELIVKRNWENGTVTASANRLKNKYIINMFGGLARHQSMTKDGLALVICHELGHHLGGAPKIGTLWASNEGQSDYFAGLKCLRRVFATENSVKIVKQIEVDPVVKDECLQSFADKESVAICIRSAMAGQALALVFRNLRKETAIPAFDTPDPTVVAETYHRHPATQCRLDTYLAGSICTADLNIDVSDKDPHVGVCSRKFGETRGARPLCWYSENDSFVDALLPL